MADVTTEVKKPEKEKKSFFSKVGKFFRGYVSEFKKIVWPTWKQVRKNTLVTIVMVIAVGIFIWLLDFAFGWLLDFVLGLIG